jgi:hypothetical protein
MGGKTRAAFTFTLGASFYLLFLLVLLDFDENCSMANCALVHHYLNWAYVFDFAYLIPFINSLPIPLTLRLDIPCFALFATLLFSVLILRLNNGMGRALLDCLAVGLASILLFEIGVYFLSPTWWAVHFSNFTEYPLSTVTNEILFFAALLLFIGNNLFRVLRRGPESLFPLKHWRHEKK